MATPTGISKRSDGRWTVKHQGKQTTCKTEADAKRKLKEMKATSKSQLVDVEKLTVSDAVQKWLKIKASKLKPRSYDRLEQTWNNQIKGSIGHIQFSSLKSYDIEDMLLTLHEKNYSKSTIKKAYDLINDCCKYYHKKNEISNNPAAYVEVPSGKEKPKGEIVFYTEEELEEICATATKTYSNGSPIYPQGWAIVLLANTGMRFCELSGLTWSNVDLKRKVLHVKNTRVIVKNRDESQMRKTKTIEQTTTKTENGKRDIPLNKKACTALEHLAQTCNGAKYVLSTRSGTPLGQKSFDTTFRRILRASGIDEDKIYGVHALRHSFATNLIRSKVPTKIVSKLLGHSDITITLQTYVHALQDDYSDAVAVLD